MTEITRLQASFLNHNSIVTEASSVGIRPGVRWPTEVYLVEGDTRTRFLRRPVPIVNVNEFAGWRYACGERVISIFND